MVIAHAASDAEEGFRDANNNDDDDDDYDSSSRIRVGDEIRWPTVVGAARLSPRRYAAIAPAIAIIR